MYIFCCFEEVSAIKWSKMVTFSITGSQIFFANFVIFARNERKTGYQFTVPTTTLCLVLTGTISKAFVLIMVIYSVILGQNLNGE